MFRRVSFLLLAALLLGSSSARAGEPTPLDGVSSFDPLPLMVRLGRLSTMREKLEMASAAFLGTRYVSDPLGEGPGHPPDTDPRIRFDAFDCQTYIETVMALVDAPRPSALLTTLDQIRYAGAPTYEQRNHFFDHQWVPSAQAKGFIREITGEVGGDLAATFTKTVTSALWEHRTQGLNIVLPEDRAPLGTRRISYIPIERVTALASRIPSGTLFGVVHTDRPEVPWVNAHLGFVIRKGNRVFARHAGKGPYFRVVDEELSHFAARGQNRKGWKIAGLQLFEVLKPPSAPLAASGD